MIDGAHVILYSSDANADRAFLGELLGSRGVDVGGGWLIFALPPAEVAVHPTDGESRHELYLMCGDIEGTLAEVSAAGVEIVRGPTEAGWGEVATIAMPSGAELSLYEPRHPIAHAREQAHGGRAAVRAPDEAAQCCAMGHLSLPSGGPRFPACFGDSPATRGSSRRPIHLVSRF